MKKSTLLVFSLLAVFGASCTNQDDLNDNSSFIHSDKCYPIRSYDEALQAAKSAIPMLNGSNKTRSSIDRVIDLDATRYCIVSPSTRSIDSNINDTLLYVFNFSDNKGFAIISASKRTQPILAITESGNYDFSKPSGIEGFDTFMDLAKEYVIRSYSRDPEPVDTTEVETYEEYDYKYNNVGPYIDVQWGQTHPEGEFCPNGISGCSITAIAQIMSYYEYPSIIDLTYPNADRIAQLLDWNNMRNHSTGHTVSECASSQINAHKSIGRLCRQLGFLANSTYGNEATGTNESGISTCLQQIGYRTEGWRAYNADSVKYKLDCSHPLLAGGFGFYQNDIVGHSWIIDGYNSIEYTIYCYSQRSDGSPRILLFTYGPVTEELLFHINWGWYGTNNGYFASNVFNTSLVQSPDTPNNDVNINFNINIGTLDAYPSH